MYSVYSMEVNAGVVKTPVKLIINMVKQLIVRMVKEVLGQIMYINLKITNH